MLEIDVQGQKVPALGFGTWQLAGKEAQEATRHALEIGYRQIDTAQMYGNEAEVGRGIAESGVPRDEVFLTTKLFRENLTADRVGPAVDESLRKLATDYVDLLLIHWPNPDIELGETLAAMRVAQDAGKVRHLGVSNFKGPLLLEAMEHATILADQVPYQPGRSQNTLRAIAAERDVMITAYSPLRGDGMQAPVLAEIAKAHGKSVQQVVLRWLLQQDKVSPIPRSANPKHRQQNFEVFDFELSDEDMAKVDGITVG